MLRDFFRNLAVLACVFAFWVTTYTVLRAEAIIPLNQTLSSGGAGSGVTWVSTADGILVNGGSGPVAGAITLSLGTSITVDTITSNPGTPVTLDGANGTVAIAAGDTLTADIAALTTITATTVTSTNVTTTAIYVNTIATRTNGIVLKFLNSEGIQLSDDGETASFISTLIPTANTLTLNVAGTGVFALDASDTLTAGASVITVMGYTTATGTTSITTNTTASTLYVNTIRPRTFGAQTTIANTAGWNFTDDGGGATASMIVAGAASRVTFAMLGSGFFTISGNDVLESNTLQSTTVNNTVTVQGNTAGGVLLDGTNGYVAVGAGDVLEADILEPVTTNTTLTLRGKQRGVTLGGSFITGTAGAVAQFDTLEPITANTTLTVIGKQQGVSFGAGRVQIAALAGSTGADANGATPQRFNGAYQATAIGTANQVPTVNGGATQWAWGGTPGQLTAPCGLVCNRASANTVSVVATSVEVVDSSNLRTYLRSVSVTPDISAAVGANGPDASGVDDEGWKYVFVIWNGSTTAGLISESATAPTMPSGYTHKAFVCPVYNHSDNNLLEFTQYGRSYNWSVDSAALVSAGGGRVLNSGSSTSFADVDASKRIPVAVSRQSRLNCTMVVSITATLRLREKGQTSMVFSGCTAGSAVGNNTAYVVCSVDSSGFLQYRVDNASDTAFISVLGFEISVW